MPEAAPRVVVLARPGEACDRLQDAVRGAGAELVGTCDPLATDAAAVAGLAPAALVVALEPALEDVLERFQPLLDDPAITVVFDEAELAAQRSGWDAARWVRHLAAKLHRHDDVLPPGAGQDADPVPELDDTPLRFDDGIRDVSAEDLELVADEMRTHAADVPHDGLLASPLEALEPGPGVLDLGSDGDIPDSVTLDGISMGGMSLDDVVLDTGTPGDATDHVDGAGFDDGFGELVLEGVTLDDLVLDAADDDDDDDDGARVPQDPERTWLEPVDLTWDAPAADDGPATGDGGPAAAPSPGHATPVALPDGSGFSLADPGPLVPPPDAASSSDRFADLDSRIGGLSLVDVDSYGFGELQGAVLVEGGLGGPDPVRQLLAALPQDFPRALLVRLRLDGGRYDRLVRQMVRATTLPVVLAEDGGTVERGHVYFLPPDLDVAVDRGRLRFAAGAADVARLPGALPAADSALVFLSGADARLVDDAMGADWSGALVMGQSLDGCYDATAAARVAEHGGTLAEPAALATLLVERWAPGAAATGIELETRDE